MVAQFAPVVLTAWDALIDEVTKDGQIQGVCMGTGVGDTIQNYAERPQCIIAYHGQVHFWRK